MSRARAVDGLFERITAFDNLLAAARRSVRGKRERLEPAAFFAGLERELLRLQSALRDGSWRPGGFRTLRVRDPKPREISIAPFADRVVHQALCAVIGPVFERGWIADSYASRTGLGQHRAIARFEHFRNGAPWVLRADIYRYFPSIDHELLKAVVRRRIACAPTLALIDCIVDGSNPQEPVPLYFPGDELWTPHERRRGLPLGNLTSQLLGNAYLDGLDHYVQEVLRPPGYLRYLDDIVCFAPSREASRDSQARIAHWLERRRLRLHLDKTVVLQSHAPQVFLGLELHAGGYRRLPDEALARARGRIDRWRAAWAHGDATEDDVRRSLGSWVAHARHADTWRLRSALFPAGWFRPREEPLRLRTPVARRRVEQRTEERALGQSQPRRPDEP